MGILDKLKQGAKDITGIGLNATEQYLRAYQKGVLLTPPNYKAAIDNFETAAEKFTKDGNSAMAKRALANAALYTLISTKEKMQVAATISALAEIPEVERPGSNQEMIPTAPLITELTALKAEIAADNAPALEDKIAGYKSASDVIMRLGNAEFQFTQLLQMGGPTDKGMNRGLYYLGLVDYCAAHSVIRETPDKSVDKLQSAAGLFNQAQSADWARKVTIEVQNVGTRRHCWMCNREMQGKNLFFKYYPSRIEKYHGILVEKLKQDPGMLEQPGHITLCTACGTAIEQQADNYAKLRVGELRSEVVPILSQHGQLLDQHTASINALSSQLESLRSAIRSISHR